MTIMQAAREKFYKAWVEDGLSQLSDNREHAWIIFALGCAAGNDITLAALRGQIGIREEVASGADS